MGRTKRGTCAVVCLMGFWLGAGLILPGWSEERRSESTTTVADRLDLQTLSYERTEITGNSNPRAKADQLDLAVLGFTSYPALQVDTLNLQILNGLKQCGPLTSVPRPIGNEDVPPDGAVMTAPAQGESTREKPASEPVETANSLLSERPPLRDSPPSPVPPDSNRAATWPVGTRFWWWGDRRYHDSPEPGTVYQLPGSTSLCAVKMGCVTEFGKLVN